MRSIRLAVTALSSIVLLAAAPAARAGALHDPSTGLRLDTSAAGVEVCNLIPPDRPGTPGCAGIDVADLAAKLRAQPQSGSAVALLRFPEWAALAMVRGDPGLVMRSSDNIDEFLRGMRKSMPGGGVEPRGDAPGRSYDILKIHDIDVVRTTAGFSLPRTDEMYPLSFWRVHLFASRTGSATFMVTGPPDHAAELTRLSDAIAATASMPDAGIEDFGRSKDYFLGKLVGQLVVHLVWVVGGVVALIVHLRRRKKAAPR